MHGIGRIGSVGTHWTRAVYHFCHDCCRIGNLTSAMIESSMGSTVAGGKSCRFDVSIGGVMPLQDLVAPIF